MYIVSIKHDVLVYEQHCLHKAIKRERCCILNNLTGILMILYEHIADIDPLLVAGAFLLCYSMKTPQL